MSSSEESRSADEDDPWVILDFEHPEVDFGEDAPEAPKEEGGKKKKKKKKNKNKLTSDGPS